MPYVLVPGGIALMVGIAALGHDLLGDPICGGRRFSAWLAAASSTDPAERARAVPVLADALGSWDHPIRDRAAGALRDLGPEAKAAIPALAGRLAVGFPGNPTVIEALIRMSPEGLEAILESRQIGMIVASDLGPAFSGIAGLARRNPEAAQASVPALSRFLADREGGVRASAARLLADLGPSARAAIPLLPSVFEGDPDPEARVEEARAMWRITGDPKAAVEALAAVLREACDTDRIRAAEVLGEIGPAAAAAVPALEANRGRVSIGVRKAAEDALKRIRGVSR